MKQIKGSLSNLIVVWKVEEADLFLEAAEASRGRRQALAAAARGSMVLVLLLLGLQEMEDIKNWYHTDCTKLIFPNSEKVSEERVSLKYQK